MKRTNRHSLLHYVKPSIALGILVSLTVALTVKAEAPTRPVAELNHSSLLKQDMRFMYSSLLTLFSLASDTSVSDSARLNQVLKELDILDVTARVIKNGEELYGYSVADPYLGSFLHDVSMAREFAQLTPPDYGPATGLIRSCLVCHEDLGE